MDVITITLLGIIMAVLLFTALYDLKYQDVFLLAPLIIWALGYFIILARGGDTFSVLIQLTSGLFLFVIGLMLYITGGTGFGDALLFFAIGFVIGDLQNAVIYLGYCVLFFVPFFIAYIIRYWKQEGYDITMKGFLRQVAVKDLKEGMVLSQSKVWKGIDKDGIDVLKKEHPADYKVWIKEGIPFAPAMFVAFVGLLMTHGVTM